MLVEEAIAGREIEVGVLGDDPPETSVPGEIVPGDDFYTYADKYEHDDAELLAPAPLTDDQAAEVRALAVRGFEACRCEAMARVDFFLEESPTRRSTGPRVPRQRGEHDSRPDGDLDVPAPLGAVAGSPYAQLFDRLIALALDRHARRTRRAGRQRDD